MEAVVLVIHLIVAVGIIVVVLIQPAEAGGFVGGGGGGNAMTPRRSADIMTRITTTLAGIFFLTSLGLAILATKRTPIASILELAADKVTTEAPVVPGVVLDAEKKKSKAPQAPISK